MSTYIPQIQDYIPQVQPFRPDLNFYANVLQTKQSQYDQAYNKVSSLYGSLLNSPMSRDSNIQRRDKFFQTVDQDIKKISGLDLSKQQNVDVAMQVFRPVLEDRAIHHDMVFTKQWMDGLQTAENYKNCVDPDKCGGSYWRDGVDYLNYKRQEYREADNNSALSMQMSSYVPSVNYTKEFIKAAKDAGFNVSRTSIHGGYQVTDQNGQLLMTNADGTAGILPNFLMGAFKDNGKIMDMFHVQAYNARKGYSEENAARFGGDKDAAEQEYINNVLGHSVNRLTKEAENAGRFYEDTDTKSKLLRQQAEQAGGIIPGSPEESLLSMYDRILATKPAADNYHETVQNIIKTSAQMDNINELRARADSIVAHDGFQSAIWNAANEYAMGTSKQEIKADPFALEQVRFGHELALKDKDLEIFAKKEEYKQNQLYNSLLKMGLTKDQAQLYAATGGISAAELKDLRKKVGTETKFTRPTTLPAAKEEGTSVVMDNDNTYHEQAVRTLDSMSNYVKIATTNLIHASQYGDPTQKQDAANILKNLYGVNYQQATKDFERMSELNQSDPNEYAEYKRLATKYAAVYPKVVANALSKTSKYWTRGDDFFQADVTAQANSQALKQFTEQRRKDSQVAKNQLIDNTLFAGGKPTTSPEAKREAVAYSQITDDNGHVKDEETFAKDYVKSSKGLFQPVYRDVKGEHGVVLRREIAKTPEQVAYEAAKDNYKTFVSKYNDQYSKAGGKAFKGIGGATKFGGGAMATPNEQTVQVQPHQTLNPETDFAEKVFKNAEIEQGAGDVIFYTGNPQDRSQIKNDATAQNMFNLYSQSFLMDLQNANDKKDAARFTITTVQAPAGKIEGKEYGQEVIHKIVPSVGFLKSKLGKTFNLDYYNQGGYNVNVVVPAETDITGYVEATQVHPLDMAMNLGDKPISYSHPDMGNIYVKKTGTGYSFGGYVNTFDANTGKFGRYDISQASNALKAQGVLSDDMTMKDLYPKMADYLKYLYQVGYVVPQSNYKKSR